MNHQKKITKIGWRSHDININHNFILGTAGILYIVFSNFMVYMEVNYSYLIEKKYFIAAVYSLGQTLTKGNFKELKPLF